MLAGILSTFLFVILFFQNYGPITIAQWQFLLSPFMTSNSGMMILVGFLGGFASAALFFLSVKGGRYDPSPSVHGKEQPDAWDRIADQN